ncbi:transcriptional regulator, XRE family with cupin sensor [Jatrophihabitans endophyticus]|uniref:Transcriptional regulator, XRE family with cupin sensor n=1 Tax=Jatrophihabitans endophyticus TaxID=1206085 RepID=A0A1M5PGS7_9ACTN|nr:XRE family transcriptional regulator [Jatrophihabitans endophyticus]SHH00975.1 transcriptional regulator, XRE family with cupin sensor [Jatrophihabitans endophyticus]
MTDTRADASLALRIGARLRALRTGQRLTLATLAGRAGISVSYLSAVEKGVNLPSLQVLAAVTEALGASIPAVLADEGSPHAVVGAVPSDGAGAATVSHPLLQLRNAVIRSVAGDTGDPPVEVAGRDLFLYVLSGRLVVHVDGQDHELRTGDAVDVSRPGLVSWSAAEDTISVWSSCPDQS